MKIDRLIAAALFAMPMALCAGSPKVSQAFPAAAQRGNVMEVTFSGTNLGDAQSILFDEPGFETEKVSAEQGKFVARIKVSPEARLGEHRFRAVTATGLSDVRLFFVTPFPMVAAVKEKGKPDAPQPIAMNTTVYGHTPLEAQDSVEVEVKKGERLSAEVIGVRLGTQNIFDPMLTIAQANGKVLATVDDCAFTQQDPVASILAPEDGKYVITVKDSTNTGPGPCQYLLNVGSFPRPVAIYPAGGPAGETVKVQLIGDPAGPIEQQVKLPDQPDEHFAVLPEKDPVSPQANFIRVSKLPNILEAEPNDEIAQVSAAPASLPAAFNGVIEKKGDVDYFKFTAAKGADYDVTVYARRLRSPLDSVIDLYNEKGVRLAGNDDAGGPDSYLRWKAPADGTYFLGIHDQLGRGGPTYFYRIEIEPLQPKVSIYLPEMVQNQNQERRAFAVPKGNRYASLVKVKRQDFSGELRLEPRDLPAGITVSAPTMDKSVDTIPMVFEAAPEATPTVKHFTIEARPTEAPAGGATLVSAVDNDLDIAENGNQKSYYTVRQHMLPVQISEEAPVKINVIQPKTPLLQAGSINLKVVAERKGDFKGAINLALLYAPPGIGTAGTVAIKENENEAVLALSANGNAPLQKWKICVVGSADFGKGPVWISTGLIDLEVAPPFLGGQIVRTFVDQGDTTTMTVKLEQKLPFEGKAKLQLLGLPPNTTADVQECTKDDKEVKFTVKAEKNAPAATHKQLFCQFTLEKDGEAMTSSFGNGGILRVDKGSVAKNEEAKK